MKPQLCLILLLLSLFLSCCFAHIDTNSTNPNDTPRVRTNIIKTAPEVVLIIGACIMVVFAGIALAWILLRVKHLQGITLYMMMNGTVPIAAYFIAIAYFLTSQNVYMLPRDDHVVVMAPIIVVNVVLWYCVAFSISRFLRLDIAVHTMSLRLALTGLVVQALASGADGVIQWIIYFLGLLPLFGVPVLFYLFQKRNYQKRWTEPHTIASISVASFLYCFNMGITLAGHSFGGKYKGLGASDEIALQIVHHFGLMLLLIYLASKALPPQGRVEGGALTALITTVEDDDVIEHKD